MISTVKQFVLQVTSQTFSVDGTSATLTIDLASAPIPIDLAGHEPAYVIAPAVSNSQGTLPVLATIAGTVITLTFPTPPPATDENGNLLSYTASFSLQADF